MNETPVFEEAKQTYLQLTSNLDDTVRKHFTEWQMLAEKEIGKGSKNDAHKRLEQPLMIRSHDRHGMIEVNFDRSVTSFSLYIFNAFVHMRFDQLFHVHLITTY